MATFSGGLKLKLDKVNKQLIDNIIGKEVRRVERLGKFTMRQLREQIVNEWFDEFNGESMNESTKYISSFKQSGKEVVVTITSYVDIAEYDGSRLSASRWRKKYGGDLDSGEYVLGLQFDEGIIGLPEKATYREDSHWVNNYFHQQEPLEPLLKYQLVKQWGEAVLENNSKIK